MQRLLAGLCDIFSLRFNIPLDYTLIHRDTVHGVMMLWVVQINHGHF